MIHRQAAAHSEAFAALSPIPIGMRL